MPYRLKSLLRAIWRFPAKGVALLLLAVILWEGDVSRNGPLPPACLTILGLAFALLFFDRGFPIKVCVGLVILNLAARESYPFSHFPMYDRFTDHTFYVYVADKDGQPVPLQTVTSIRTSRLKKPYDKALDQVRKKLGKRKRELSVADRRAAGEQALIDVYRDSNAEAKAQLEALAPLRLYHVDAFMRDGELDERDAQLVATLDLPPK